MFDAQDETFEELYAGRLSARHSGPRQERRAIDHRVSALADRLAETDTTTADQYAVVEWFGRLAAVVREGEEMLGVPA